MFTSESVTEGHPDKICDAISDAVLDALLAQDPASRAAVEALVTTGQVHVVGEVTSEAYVDIPGVVREQVLRIGYDSSAVGFDGHSCGVNVAIDAQSPDIARGVARGYEARLRGVDDEVARQGAGDQGMMFGYACDETPERMPLPIALAHRLARRLAEVRRGGLLPHLRPDGKTQVTIAYEGDRPVALGTVVLSAQHSPAVEETQLDAEVRELVLAPELARLESVGVALDRSGARVLVNPTGRFVLGGPAADAGLTGRKIMVDTYGGMARHGGGAFSGKDPSKVDRSAAYALRWVAVNALAAGLARRIEVQVAYAIGTAAPIGLFVETFGTETAAPHRIRDAIGAVFDLRPAAIIRDLDLLRPRYTPTAAYGHFGRTDLDLPWEHPDRAAALRAAL
ncbi:methionine adenosyltransferase [Saccharopolyspora sp. MS10]|uniref:methionine adenosyltransferase n=1 Tax=Saccharopolyspora sp. MS10 TaxID=3385973 RepID=UPI0039A25C06